MQAAKKNSTRQSDWLILSSVPMSLQTQSPEAMGIGTSLHDRHKERCPRRFTGFAGSPHPALTSYSILHRTTLLSWLQMCM